MSFYKCNKKTYPDKISAVTMKNHREGEGEDELRIYYCDGCRGWHLSKVKFWRR